MEIHPCTPLQSLHLERLGPYTFKMLSFVIIIIFTCENVKQLTLPGTDPAKVNSPVLPITKTLPICLHGPILRNVIFHNLKPRGKGLNSSQEAGGLLLLSNKPRSQQTSQTYLRESPSPWKHFSQCHDFRPCIALGLRSGSG